MNKALLLSLTIALCGVAAQALQCYKCDIGLGSLCYTTKINCASTEQCFSGVGKAVGFLEVKIKGCLAVAQCNKTENVNFPSNSTTVYSMTKTCCNTDLCNSAPDRSHVSALMMTLTAIAVKFIM